MSFILVHLKPGLSLALPILHQVQKVDMREAGMVVEKIDAFTKDNVPVHLSAVLFYQVKSAYKACFDVSDYRSAIYSVGTSSLRSIVGRFEYDQIIGDRNKLNKEWLIVVGNSVEHWGVETTKAEIQSFGPLDSSVAKTLEKQMDAERDRRQQELNTRAKINISEGEKQSMILHSEGNLIAAKNLADAAFLTAQKQAEAQRYLIEQETFALTEQLQTISKALNSDHYLTVQYLLARRRFDELQAIANGKNNSTYFINNQTEGVHSLKIFSDLQKQTQDS
jgi:regulator of protease activity HflC (stomatin/prohibitin superfamily)